MIKCRSTLHGRLSTGHALQFYPHASLLGLGFSLGANILTWSVAEEGESYRLVSACVLASMCIPSPFTHFSLLIREFQPWDILNAGYAYALEPFTSSRPTRVVRSLEDNWFARHVYSKSLAAGLKKIFRGHLASSPIPALLRLSRTHDILIQLAHLRALCRPLSAVPIR